MFTELMKSISQGSIQILKLDVTKIGARSRRRVVSSRTAGGDPGDAEASACHCFLEGVLTRGDESSFAVAGDDIVIDAHTWIFGELALGSDVQVVAILRKNGERYAKKVVVQR